MTDAPHPLHERRETGEIDFAAWLAEFQARIAERDAALIGNGAPA